MVKFGIIGGHGAVASAQFHIQLIEAFLEDGAYEDEDFPSFIISNLPEKTVNSAGTIINYPQVSQLLSRTVAMMGDIDYLLILCNTFHSPQVEIATTAKKLSLPQITAEHAVAASCKRPLVVCTSISTSNNLYDNPEYEVAYYPGADLLIEAGMGGQTDHPTLASIIEEAKQLNCDSIILGCTDLTRFAPQLLTMTDLTVIDSVEAAVHKVKELNNESV